MIGYKYTTEELANEARQTIDTQFGYPKENCITQLGGLPEIDYNPVLSELPI
jgi:hypothetical protein